MNKKTCAFVLLLALSTGALFAKTSLILDIGPVFTRFDHLYNSDNSWSTNTGGVNVLLRGEFAKNFGAYGMANLAFGNRLGYGSYAHKVWNTVNVTYAIDGQFGFFYAFKPIKNLAIMLGLGFGLGGSGYNGKYDLAHQTNIGGGFNLDVSYMFSNKIGIYGGLSDTMYAPVSRYSGDPNGKAHTYSGSAAGRFANSFSLKAGVQLVF